MPKKIQIRRRDLQVPGQPHPRQASKKPVAKRTKVKITERDVELKRKRTALNRIKRQLTALNATAPKSGNPKRYSILQQHVEIAIGYFTNPDGSLNEHTYKWLVPAGIDLSTARFGQIIQVPGRDGKPQDTLYAYSQTGQQRRYRNGKVEPAATMLSLTERMGTPEQVEAMGKRVTALEKKQQAHRAEYEGHRKLTRAIARQRNRMRKQATKLSGEIEKLK